MKEEKKSNIAQGRHNENLIDYLVSDQKYHNIDIPKVPPMDENKRSTIAIHADKASGQDGFSA